MLISYLSSFAFLASLSVCVLAQELNLASFPDVVQVDKTYTLSWTASGNFTYTIWLVLANDNEGGIYNWAPVEGLAKGLYYPDLNPSYEFTVPSNVSTAGYFYALWINATPVPFNGSNVWNITNWFSISTTAASSTTTVGATTTPSATHTSAASTHTPSSEHEHDRHNSLSGGAIAGIVIGILVAAAIIVGALLLGRMRKRKTGIRDREAQARANRLAPVMQSPAAIEMNGRNPELAKEIDV